MNRRNTREKMCEGKIRYPTFQSAAHAAKYNRRKGLLKKDFKCRMDTYKCRFCRYFHNGNRPHTFSKGLT